MPESCFCKKIYSTSKSEAGILYRAIKVLMHPILFTDTDGWALIFSTFVSLSASELNRACVGCWMMLIYYNHTTTTALYTTYTLLSNFLYSKRDAVSDLCSCYYLACTTTAWVETRNTKKSLVHHHIYFIHSISLVPSYLK